MSESVEEILRRYLVDELGLPPDVTTESALMRSGLLGSAQLLDVVIFLEDTFGVVMRPIDVVPEKMKTIAAIADVVRERMAPGAQS